MATIKDKVVWDNVRDILNKGGGNVTNDIKTGFVASANIRYTSRKKPVPWPDDFPDTDLWWKAKIKDDHYNTGRCGVDFPLYTSSTDLVGKTDIPSLWKHKFPIGGLEQPFRTDDFLDYDSEAKDFILNVSVNPKGDIALGNSGLQSNCMIIFNTNYDTSSLDYSEISYREYESDLSDFYFGVIAIKEGGYSHGCISQPYTLKELNTHNEGDYYGQDDHRAFVVINSIFNNIGLWDVYPVLFQHKVEEAIVKTNESINDISYIPLPVKPIRVNVDNPAAKLTVQPIKVNLISGSEQMGVEVRVTIRVKNENENITYTFDGNNQYIEAGIARYYEFVEGGGEYVYARYTGAEFSIPGGSTKDIEIVVSNSEIKPSDGWLLAASRIKFGEDIITRNGFPLIIE